MGTKARQAIGEGLTGGKLQSSSLVIFTSDTIKRMMFDSSDFVYVGSFFFTGSRKSDGCDGRRSQEFAACFLAIFNRSEIVLIATASCVGERIAGLGLSVEMVRDDVSPAVSGSQRKQAGGGRIGRSLPGLACFRRAEQS